MQKRLIFQVGSTPALICASRVLSESGFVITDHPTPEVTHLLYDIPVRDPKTFLLQSVPDNVALIGGKMNQEAFRNYRCFDLLNDPLYLTQNAGITAYCALKIASKNLGLIFWKLPVLILGWGRIGKILGKLLQSMGAQVHIAARKETDLALIRALGYADISYSELDSLLPEMCLIINTVPAPLLSPSQLSNCRDCVKIDLASTPGISSPDVIWARGLPGIHAPESSGRLIADTVIRILKENE